jgi:uncharacterized cupin superfamily protein
MERHRCPSSIRNASDGHHLVNKSGTTAVCLEIGTRTPDDRAVYPDIDMMFDSKVGRYAHRDGTPYPAK